MSGHPVLRAHTNRLYENVTASNFKNALTDGTKQEVEDILREVEMGLTA